MERVWTIHVNCCLNWSHPSFFAHSKKYLLFMGSGSDKERGRTYTRNCKIWGEGDHKEHPTDCEHQRPPWKTNETSVSIGQERSFQDFLSIIVPHYCERLLTLKVLCHNPFICIECAYSLKKDIRTLKLLRWVFVCVFCNISPTGHLISPLTHMCTDYFFVFKTK